MNAFVLLKRQIFNLLSERLKIGEVYTKSEERAAFGNFKFVIVVYICESKLNFCGATTFSKCVKNVTQVKAD